MARQFIEKVMDDLTGEEIPAGRGETIRFAVNGSDYTIDLNAKNAKSFWTALEPYIKNGTRIGRSGRRPASSKGSKEDLRAIREWARNNGYDVADRGRVSQETKDAYYTAK